MNRRAFIATAAGLLAAPRAGEAQPAAKVPRIGWLWVISSEEGRPLAQRRFEMFRQALAEIGYVDGRNIVIEDRSAVGTSETARDIAAELVRLKVDVIVVRTAVEAVPAKKATSTIPIVFFGVSDAVALKLVDSLARPGGNMTGLSYLALDLIPKRLELLKELLPRITRVAVLGDATHPLLPKMITDLTVAAEALKVQLQVVTVKIADDLEGAFSTMSRARAEALLILTGPFFSSHGHRLAELSMKRRLPGIYEWSPYVEAGGLMAYGVDQYGAFQRTAYYVDRILKGAKPEELPVEQPTKLELVINMKTAKNLGIRVPQSLLLRARIIERRRHKARSRAMVG